jgi:hypothetical protein
MLDINESLSSELIALEEAQAAYNIAKAGYEGANEELLENIDYFY